MVYEYVYKDSTALNYNFYQGIPLCQVPYTESANLGLKGRQLNDSRDEGGLNTISIYEKYV